MLTRRDFLKTSSLIAFAPTVPGFLAQTARAAKVEKDGRILVVIQLDGGNDGINTVVPYADEGYAKHRKTLRLPTKDLLQIDAKVGLHRSLRGFAQLLESKQLAIVQGVGYPNPNRSHFESMAIWHTARFDPEERNDVGWLGKALDGSDKLVPGMPASVFVGGGQLPMAVRGRRSIASALTRQEDFVLAPGTKSQGANAPRSGEDDLASFIQRSTLDAYATADRMADIARAKDGDAGYPNSDLSNHLRLVSKLIKGAGGTRVYYARQSGYDTHAGQQYVHANLLSDLSGAVKAFLDDLTAAKLADRVVVLAFSEFGRTVKENGSAGTDHGTAGPVFLAGPQVKPGLVGTTPSLLDLDPKHGDLRMSVDFRRVYATVLENWLQLASKAVLGNGFQSLPLFRG